ncbi:MAG: membrane protein insertase YidC [Candidatus Binatia bacterium]|jgi:YidC/Oxa1 family membrane protein insertase|nr:membrane protein insertase YidC [Candidatus Binatia bacterium]
MEKNAFIAVIISLLILILYNQFVSRWYEPPPSSQPAQEKVGRVTPPPAVSSELSQPRRTPDQPPQKTRAIASDVPAREVKVETDRYVAVFTNRGARMKSFRLNHYRMSLDEQSPPFEMISSTPGVPYPLGIELNDPAPFNDKDLMYNIKGNHLTLTGDDKEILTFEGRTPSGSLLTKKLTFSGASYVIELDIGIAGMTRESAAPRLLLSSEKGKQPPNRDAPFEGLLGLVDGELIRETAEKAAKEGLKSGQVDWAGFGYTYFLFAMLPEMETEPGKIARQSLTVKQREPGILLGMQSQNRAAPGGNTSYRLFVGPKDLKVLEEAGGGLDQSINFGTFLYLFSLHFIVLPFLQILRFSHGFTGSYGIDIILLTLLIKLLLAPLTHKSFVSMKQMQKLQPQMQRIKDKFKDDREKMNKEVMELYKRNKVNPLGGCFPMLLQLPVFIGLYNALSTPIELRHTPFLWIKDLSRPDWESLPFSLGGWELGIPVLVLLMGASMFLQQWMTPTAGDPNQKRLMYMMPVVFTVMFVSFPAGLTIYWFVNNVLTIGQQYLINRMTR